VDSAVHYDLTLRWALDEGFPAEEAEAIAVANLNVDRDLSGPYLRHRGWHYAWLGARRRARRLLAEAIENRDLMLLGRALHCEQDGISHGQIGHIFHYRGIDSWERRSAWVRRRIEHASREMLAAYRSET